MTSARAITPLRRKVHSLPQYVVSYSMSVTSARGGESRSAGKLTAPSRRDNRDSRHVAKGIVQRNHGETARLSISAGARRAAVEQRRQLHEQPPGAWAPRAALNPTTDHEGSVETDARQNRQS